MARIAKAGGVWQKNKGLLFELRFGNALHEKGIVPDYEIAGECDSTIDFGFTHDGMAWAAVNNASRITVAPIFFQMPLNAAPEVILNVHNPKPTCGIYLSVRRVPDC